MACIVANTVNVKWNKMFLLFDVQIEQMKIKTRLSINLLNESNKRLEIKWHLDERHKVEWILKNSIRKIYDI